MPIERELMRFSRLLVRTTRDAPADAEAAGHQLLARGGFVRRVDAGRYALLPLGQRVLRNIEHIVREELEGVGAQEVWLPDGTREIASWLDLPAIVYQVRARRRDGSRPRSGLLRARESLVAEAWSFGASDAELDASYQLLKDACARAFERSGVLTTEIEAAGGIYFMVPSSFGEDEFVRCDECGFAAAPDLARPPAPQTLVAFPPQMEERETPDATTVAHVAAIFGVEPQRILKTLAVLDDQGDAVLALVPGDREALLPAGWRPFTDEDFGAHPYLVKGYLGPMGAQAHGLRVVADQATNWNTLWIAGANHAGFHVSGASNQHEFAVDEYVPLTRYQDGDACPRCHDGRLQTERAVAAGRATRDGATLDLTRTLALVAEQHHDDAGLVWPAPVAPYDVHLLALGTGRNPEVADAADRLYEDLLAAGVAALYDDREASPGVKFADADLLGLPAQLVVGAKGLARGVVERKDRGSGERDELPIEHAARAMRG